ncbi:SDR family NAD(P)-dependent oxidoreductase [Streptomyces sp. 8N114]|uniref:SDR family NAD(P)-dependent oxidoreductase n=1 Tax=Streptomyces sp. 8N114 TaxID=3457419 RepID=UPI003FD6AC13
MGRISMPERLTFDETFTVTADNPLLQGHVVHGRHLLPGVGYVDLILQVLSRHGYDMSEVELRNLTILAPLVAAPGERVPTTVRGRPAAAGGCRIEVVSSRQDTPRQGGPEVVHATVNAHRHALPAFRERLTLPVTGAHRHTPLADLYAWLRGLELVHSGLMKVNGGIHHRSGDWVAEVELDPAHQDTADAFPFHPALFEAGVLGAGVGLHMLYEGEAAEDLYLPLVFESFRASAPLGRRCFVRVPADSAHRDDELMQLAVEFYDETGRQVAELNRIVAKRVRSADTLDVRSEPQPGAARPATGVSAVRRADEVSAAPGAPDAAEVVTELVTARLALPPGQVNTGASFYDIGLASADLVSMVPELEERLSLSLSPTVVFEHRSPADLAAWLNGQVAERRAATAPAAPAGRAEQPSTRSIVVEELAALLEVMPHDIAADAELGEYGLDLPLRARLAARLNERFGSALTAASLADHLTVDAVAGQVAVRPAAETRPQETRPQETPHPLLHHVSRRDGVVEYRTRLDGDEPFLRHHKVRGGRLLPAVVQLEMARAAVEAAHSGAGMVRLDDVVWLRPALCGPDGLELRVTVRTQPHGDWEYTLHAVSEDGELTVCGRGRASLVDGAAPTPPSLDELRALCSERTVPAADIYALYASVGMDYGPAQRSLTELQVGTDRSGRSQVLARLHLPEEARDVEGCRLHPSIADGALQAVIGLTALAREAGDGEEARAALPFSVQRVEAYAPTPAGAYAWIRHRPGGGSGSGTGPLDITLFDDDGRVCAEVTGLSTRTLAAPQQDGPQARDAAAAGTVTPRPAGGDIAIVGLSGRYPQAADLDEFWQNLRNGRDCIREVPTERWDHRTYADVGGSSTAKWGGFIDDIDKFDPLFFQISLHEAELLDPQERLFLQCAHHALEDSGYTGELLARAASDPDGPAAAVAPPGRVGVFVGVMYEEYQLYGAQAQDRGRYTALSGSASSIANRVSYFYDFHGPSMTVDTMCSSSLTAIHLACEAIRSGQCETAVAGGVNLHSHPNKFVLLSQRRFLSSDGRCRSFGEGGDGYVPGEGVGAVVLKPLERAVADGDHIHGVIKGTALNHGGRTTGYSVPSPAAQGEVIADAFAAAGIDPSAVGYLEAHGTGTALGDPLEVTGITRAFEAAGGSPGTCAIGSVKSNIGHCEGAAGIAGITKVLLQMRHGELVPSLHSDTLNPHIDFDGTPLRVQQRREPWQQPLVADQAGGTRVLPRLAGVSGFGAGGSNVHVVLSEYVPEPAPLPAPSGTAGRPALFVLSAQSEEQLAEQARRLRTRLTELPADALADVAWTLQVGRMALDERLAFAATTPADARARLESFLAGTDAANAEETARGPAAAWVRGTVGPGRQAPTAAGEAALRSAVSAWTGHGEYDELLRLWAHGATVHWEDLSPGGPPARRVSLPGYPFARDRCWFDLDPADGTEARRGPLVAPAAAPPTEPEGDMVLLRPYWAARELPEPGADGTARENEETFQAHHVVVLGRLGTDGRDGLRAALPSGAVCHFLQLADGAPDVWYGDAAQRLFALVREVLAGGVREPMLLQVVLAGAVPSGDGTARELLACSGGLAGLLKTATSEQPLLRTQYVECLDGAAATTVAARLAAEAAVPEPEPEVRYRDGRRLVGRLAEAGEGALSGAAPWRNGGVYLISGGAGGLGRIVAEDIAASVDHATVVLTGRSPLDEERRRDLDTLRAPGLTVDYRAVDVTDRDAVARLLARVADDHGPLTGIVHSAGVLADSFLLRKSSEDLARVLGPKVAGLVNLDELSRDQPLEFFCCFSSTAGAFGNAGQADYAAGNAFMDAYAAYRNRLVEDGRCSGRTVSIGWPLWEAGGMGGDAVRQHLRRAGLAPLDTARGLAALRHALTAEAGPAEGRLLVLVGERARLLTELTTPEEESPMQGDAQESAASGPADGAVADGIPAGKAAPAQDPVADRLLEDRAVGHLRRVLASALKLGSERLAPDAPLDRYGMDSVIAVDVISQLEESFGRLSRTLLLEVESVRELARYFMTAHPEELRALLGMPTEPEPSAPTPEPSAPTHETGPASPETGPASPGTVPADAAHAREAAPVRESVAVAQERARTAPLPQGEGRPGSGGDVAVIGISGRYPQADDLAAFWDNLRAGKDCVTEVPAERWDHKALLDSATDATGTRPSGWGGFLDGIDRFDPMLFGVSPREAAEMDPQQRLFLETVWQLMEQSGVTQDDLHRRYERRVGVYVGAAYQLYRADDTNPVLAALTSSTSYNMIANRVSHFFGLEGPSLAVDSMCTSSAMAIHLACVDLRRGETELAVAGGINLTVHPDKYLALSELQLLGSHPGSRSFRDGDGYLPAEAVGAVLLKPLDAALRDGDQVHAVIKSTSSMHSGRSSGFMMPSRRTQVNVIRRALAQADVAADSIGYVEAAANGAAMSDEIELRALREVFDDVTEPVPVGTVKSNLGHPEAASGIAQLTKVILQLRHGELAPLTEVGTPNPNLALDGTALELCERPAHWEPRQDSAPLRALVNSVAAGGSHVSLVVEAPPAADPVSDVHDSGSQLVVLSAKTGPRLRTAAERLLAFVEGDAGSVSLADVAYTCQLGREALPERLAAVVGSLDELRQALKRYLADDGEAEPGDTAVTVHTGNAEDDAGPLGAMLSGARGEAFLAGLVEDRDLEHLAELWVRGGDVPWRRLHNGPRPLAPLPPTAFEGGSYWIGRRYAPSEDTAGASRALSNGHLVDAASGDTEQIMVDVWSELLGIDAEQLGPRSDFLALGGNSLLANRLMNLVKLRTGVELPAPAVFAAPQLGELAATVDRYRPTGASGASGASEGEPVAGPQSEAQEASGLTEAGQAASGPADAEQKSLDVIALVEGMSEEELDALNASTEQTEHG